MGANTGCLKVKLIVQRHIYGCLEGGGVYPESSVRATPVQRPSMKMVSSTISGKASSCMAAIRIIISVHSPIVLSCLGKQIGSENALDMPDYVEKTPGIFAVLANPMWGKLRLPTCYT